MVAPTRTIKRNTEDSLGGSDQRSSSWVVALVRYTNPLSYTKGSGSEVEMEIIQNDAIGVTIQNPKSNFAKTCNISLKSTDFWYPSRISAGDWVFCWINDTQEDTNRIIDLLERIKANGKVGKDLINADSGLKFAGRAIGVSHSDTVAGNGRRVITQSIQAQGFLEFATSVYYTAAAQSAVDVSAGSGATTQAQNDTRERSIEGAQFRGLDPVLKDLATKFKDVYAKGNSEFTPDVIMTLYYIIIMGIDKDKTVKAAVGNISGTFNHGISIPHFVANIFNRPRAKKIWQIMNVNIGIQKYNNTGNSWWEKFSPEFESGGEGVISRTKARLKGFVPFKPALWDNVTMWNILTQYLNPVCNEIYTCLRINKHGEIMPTLVMREKPFTTGLYKSLESEARAPSSDINTEGGAVDFDDLASKAKSAKALFSFEDKKEKSYSDKSMVVSGPTLSSGLALVTEVSNAATTLYGTIPRWKIDESMIRSFSYSSSESNRVNFVQVWGRNSGSEFLGINIDPNLYRQSQFLSGNYFVDQKDISRSGLRAYIVTSPFDIYYNNKGSGTLSGIWAKLNADWLFNGQLKVSGTLVLNGVKDPIVEGDNLEVRGILFHIDDVSHSAVLSATGQKTWTTTLQVSNGMQSKSFTSANIGKPPLYVAHMYKTRQSHDGPGLTETQKRRNDSSKNFLGDSLKR